jgi:hypothetical protein
MMIGFMNWTGMLGKLGLEAPGYQETLADCRAHPWIKPKGKAKPSRSKPAKKPKYPSAKHGAD